MIRLRQISIDVNSDTLDYLKTKIAHKLNISESNIVSFSINKKSLDARKKPKLFYIYEVDVILDENEEYFLNKNDINIIKTPDEKYIIPGCGNLLLENRPVVVGSGPAGLFAAYNLARKGFKPIVIERGKKVEERMDAVNKFWESNQLNVNTNVQFGEGGAGTFSDGKLNTNVKDPNHRIKEIFKTFVQFGAPEEIIYLNKPHIGTDKLSSVIKNMRNKIIEFGGKFLYETKLTNINIIDNKIVSIEVNNKDIIKTEVVVLAIGHSARDTFLLLNDLGVNMESKPFAVGIRVIHPQKIINQNQYGNSGFSTPAEYKLIYHTKSNRGVYSFCMCPGGYVVNASSENNRLAINGMSYHNRDSKNANSAIVVTITKNDFGPNTLDGMYFQQKLEEKNYEIGKGNIPVQLYGDYINNKVSNSFKTVEPTFKGKTNFANINEILPNYINNDIKEAMEYFGKIIKGFNDSDVILASIESRTSSPIKINRNEECESNIIGLYPCGEGAGFAGGITSSAMDGLKVSENIIKKFKSF